MAHEVPALPYDFSALEPHIDAKTMEIHHDKHHAAYASKLNAALEGNADLASKSIEELVTNVASLPDNVRGAVRNNGGGHFNHSMFWNSMKPGGGGTPDGGWNEKSLDLDTNLHTLVEVITDEGITGIDINACIFIS